MLQIIVITPTEIVFDNVNVLSSEINFYCSPPCGRDAKEVMILISVS